MTLIEAKRPLMLIGNGARGAEVGKLSCVIPTATTWLASDLISNSIGKPGLLAGRAANFAIQSCDFLLVIGARLDSSVAGYDLAKFAPNAYKVVVDIDEAELEKLKPFVSETIRADSVQFAQKMIEVGVEVGDISKWQQRIGRWGMNYPIVTDERREKGPISIYNLAEIVGEMEGDFELVTGSSGNGIEIFLHAYSGPKRVYHTAGLGAMGQGLPAAIGVALATGKEVILVEGDGSLMFNVQELETIRRLKLPIKIVVLNNLGYASIRQSQRAYFGEELMGAGASTGITIPHLGPIAGAFGIPYVMFSRNQHLRDKLRLMLLAAEGPMLFELRVIPDELREPRVMTRMVGGKFVTPSLEHLSPELSKEELDEAIYFDNHA